MVHLVPPQLLNYHGSEGGGGDDQAGCCGGDGLLQHYSLYNWQGTSAPGTGAVALSAGWGMPQQAAQKPLPHSIPLPLTASGFAALNDNVKEVVPVCVLYSPRCHHGPALARVASPAVSTPVFSAAVVAKAMCEASLALLWGGGMVTRAGTVGCWGSLRWLIHPQLGATPPPRCCRVGAGTQASTGQSVCQE